MIRDSINFLLVGIGITIFAVYIHFSTNEEKIMNKFVLTVNKSYLFNWAPTMGITLLIMGEFILWESQNNITLNEIISKLLNKLKQKILIVNLKFQYLAKTNLFHINDLKISF